MMDEQKILSLIPAKALDCLDPEDELILQSYINQGLSFPWNELGTYQTVVAILPLSLQLEVPDPQLKDKIALRLIKLVEEQQPQKTEEESRPIIPESTMEEVRTEIDKVGPEIIKEENTSIEHDDFPVDFNLDGTAQSENTYLDPDTPTEAVNDQSKHTEITNEAEHFNTGTSLIDESFMDEQPFTTEVTDQLDIINENNISSTDIIPETEIKDRPDKENFEEQQTEQPNQINQEIKEKNNSEFFSGYFNLKDSAKKSIGEKVYRAIEEDIESIKKNFEESEKKLTRNLLIAYVAIAILLALLIFSFFKFTADIKSLKNEIKTSKQNATSELIMKDFNRFNLFFHV